MNEVSEDTKLTSHLENILERAVIHLIRLQEFETFEIILDYLWQGSVDVKVKVCEHLVAYGFNEIAIDLLVKLFEQYPRNIKIIEMLGDACLRSNYIQDAQLFYTKLLEVCDDYVAYERAYELYERVDDQIAKNSVLTQINRKFPFCSWSKQNFNR